MFRSIVGLLLFSNQSVCTVTRLRPALIHSRVIVHGAYCNSSQSLSRELHIEWKGCDKLAEARGLGRLRACAIHNLDAITVIMAWVHHGALLLTWYHGHMHMMYRYTYMRQEDVTRQGFHSAKHGITISRQLHTVKAASSLRRPQLTR